MSAIDFYRLSSDQKREVYSEIMKQLPLPAVSIEKDWWVVQTIALVFRMSTTPHLVFKGGTSLSKAWGIIDRLSEDVDLALSREFLGFSGNISATQVTKLRDASFRFISGKFLPELRDSFHISGFHDVEIDLIEVESPDQDPVKIAVRYPSVTEKNQYVLPQVVLEIGSRSMLEPYSLREFCSFVGEKFAEQPFADDKISVPCVNPERTFLEKLFLLHEEFQRPPEKIRVMGLSRHLFDIYKIWQTGYARIALNNPELYRTLVDHRKRFTKLSGVNYSSHFPPYLNPIPPVHLMALWEADYKTMKQQMIYGDALPFQDLIAGLESAVTEINKLSF
jgi:hypothetical protein